MKGAPLPNLDLLDADGLKALILSQHDELVATQQRLLSRESEIEHLKLLIATLRRLQFGRKSEKLERQIDQLELKLEELETAKVSPVQEDRGEAHSGHPTERQKDRCIFD
jgi:predicted RecB family endonuclease